MASFREGIQWEYKHNDFTNKHKVCSKIQSKFFQNPVQPSFSIPLPSFILQCIGPYKNVTDFLSNYLLIPGPFKFSHIFSFSQIWHSLEGFPSAICVENLNDGADARLLLCLHPPSIIVHLDSQTALLRPHWYTLNCTYLKCWIFVQKRRTKPFAYYPVNTIKTMNKSIISQKFHHDYPPL